MPSDTPTKPNKFAAVFREMADRIDRNLESDFAGAILIVPPEGEPMAMMLADPANDLAAFWAVAVSKVQLGQAEFDATARGGNAPGFGHRR